MSEQPVVLSEVRDGILVVTLNRPEARNAVNAELAETLATTMDRLDEDDELQCAVLTGAGNTFCAGMDLKAFTRGERPEVDDRGFAGLVRRPPRKPLIGAIEGYALAGGLEIALACDLLVAADDAKLGIPEAKRGLVAAGGGVFRLPKRISYAVAMELALTGDMITATRAYELGLVNRVTPPGGALDAAITLARAVAANGPLALKISKQLVARSFDWSDEESWEKQVPFVEMVLSSEDAIEGATAFAEKRDPVWRGR
jgi:enoyl-CoA hydratase